MRYLMVLFLVFPATPGASQSLQDGIISTSFDLAKVPAQALPTRKEPIIVPQFTERYDPDGVKLRQRGIIVGKDIGRNVVVGLGFMDRTSRKSSFSPNLSEESPRRSGKASILVRYKF
jgi:hypothetical protein